MRFVNDSPGEILIQTHVDGDNAYFIYYGTRDARSSDIIGPYTWGHTPAPADRTEYTTSLPPGERKKMGSAVPGLKAAWFRIVQRDGGDPVTEGYYSYYEARPLYYQVGVEEGQVPGGPAPTWLGTMPGNGSEPGEEAAPAID